MSKRLAAPTPDPSAIETGSDPQPPDTSYGGTVEKLDRLFDRLGADLRSDVQRTLETVLNLIPGQLVLYCRFDPARHEVRTYMTSGLDEDLIYSGPLESCFYYRELADAHRRQFLINDLRKNQKSRSDPFVARYGFTACLGTAVVLDDLLIGTVLVFSKKRLRLTVEQMAAVHMLARLVALITDRQNNQEKLQREIENSRLMSTIAAKAVTCSTNEFLTTCLSQISHWAQTDRVVILWYDEPVRQFYTRIDSWPASSEVSATSKQIESLQAMPIINEVLRDKLALISQNGELLNAACIKSLFPHRAPTRLLLLPLYTARQVVGLCLLSGGLPRSPWHREDMQTLKTVGIAIAHWREAYTTQRQLDESQALIYQMVQLSPTGIFNIDLRNRRFTKVNENMLRYTGYSEEELLNLDVADILTPQSREVFRQRVFDLFCGRPVPNTVEYQIVTKSGAVEWGLLHLRYIFENGQLVGANAVLHLITEHQKAMAELAEYRKKLETLVQERTTALLKANKKLKEEIVTHTQTARQLQKKTDHLKELNTAMKVLLDKRDEDRLQAQENFRVNLRQLIEPYLDRLDASGLNASQRQLLNVVRTNLNEVNIAPIPELTAKYYILTPNELQIANLIKKGRSTKDISRLLNLSPRTVESYRNSIRKKLGLQNRKVNLKTYLSSKE